MEDQPGHVLANRGLWDRIATEYSEPGKRSWASPDPHWGIWHVPEAELGVLPDVDGLRTVELGCGTGYVSSWLNRLGARPVGVDNSRAQLATARALQREFGIEFPLIHGNAERLPFADGSFDFAISEYGACLWCDPRRWVPEAARVLRPGGGLVLLVNSVLLMLCVPDDEQQPAGRELLRDQFGMYRMEWPPDPGVEFHPSHGEWIRIFRENGLEIEDLLEVRPPEGGWSRYPFVTLEWARRWPCEEVWKVRKRR